MLTRNKIFHEEKENNNPRSPQRVCVSVLTAAAEEEGKEGRKGGREGGREGKGEEGNDNSSFFVQKAV